MKTPRNSIPAVRERLLDEMADYMQSCPDCGYEQSHIERCAGIVDAYLAAVAPPAQHLEEHVVEAVKTAVLDLNALNRECGGGLIETDQREDLCEILLVAAAQAGLVIDGDITEQWREW